jgi:two-component system, LytTR family, sensor kinase
MFSTKFRYPIVLLLGVYSFINTLTVEAFKYYGIGTNKWIICFLFIALTLLIWEGNRLVDFFLKKKIDLGFWTKIALAFFLTASITLFVTLTLGILVIKYSGNNMQDSWVLPMKLLLMFAFRINLFLNIIHVIFLYQKQLDHSREEIENYKRITSQAQLQSLRNQINPHFLFNNLSVLSELISVDANASEEFVKQFSKVYRYVLNSHQKELVELKDEIDFLKSYTYLLKTRFSSGLNVLINLSKNDLNGYILPMALQMLVENAIKHNVISKSSPLILEIYSDEKHNIIVRNNLQIKRVDDEISTKVGLSNIMKRYAHLGKKDIHISKDDTHFLVSLPIIQIQKTQLNPNLEAQTI